MAIQRPVLCPILSRELNAELKDPEQKVSNHLMGGIEDILEVLLDDETLRLITPDVETRVLENIFE